MDNLAEKVDTCPLNRGSNVYSVWASFVWVILFFVPSGGGGGGGCEGGGKRIIPAGPVGVGGG